MNRYRVLSYLFGSLLLIVLLARTFETLSRPGRVFIENGVFSDKLCYLGSYEVIVCPYLLPPYETCLLVLAMMLVISVWANLKK